MPVLRSLIIVAAVMIGIVSVVMPGHSLAGVNDFVINDFSSDETLSRQTKHGHLDITEQIKVTFSDNNHGLLRALPNSYHGRPLNLKVINVSSPSGAPAQYTTDATNSNTVLKIGNPDITVTGPQSYTIHYSYDNVLSFYKDYDELYWDVSGDQWRQPIERSSVTLHVPNDARVNPGPLCFSGSYGQNTNTCKVSRTTDGGLIATANTLNPNETLTFVAGFAKGYYAPYDFTDTVSQYGPAVLQFITLPLVGLILAGSLWRKKGRDAKGRGTIIPQYEPFNKLAPIEIGTIMDFNVDNRDLTATIIDLAVRKYLKIIEQRQDHIIGKDTFTYTLELMNADMAQLTGHEIAVLTALFPQLTVGEQSDLQSNSRTGGALYALALNLRTAIRNNLTTAGYFKTNPGKLSKEIVGLIIGLILAMLIGKFIFGVFWLAGGVLAISISLIFARKMPARTELGVEALEHSQGLKLFLNVTEAERYKKLQSANADYTQTKEPLKTVELFEKLLPYAVALGVEQSWAAQFNNLYQQAPDWYSGNLNTFSALYLANNLHTNLGSQINSSFAAPTSSSSSGFSGGGGGFSGGGGGGGGGGGW